MLCDDTTVLKVLCYITDAQQIIEIKGSDGNPVDNPTSAVGGTTVSFACVATGLAANEDPELKWFDQSGGRIGTNLLNRYTGKGSHSLSL